MIEFSYVAKNKDGELQKGSIEAESESAAAKVLTSKNLFPISVYFKDKSSFSLFKHVSGKDKSFLIRQLATTVNAGLPISQALQTLKEQITNKNLKEILEQVSRDVEGGMPLSSAFSRFPDVFGQIDITLIAAGETSGTLDKVLLRLASTLENDFRIARKIRGAFVYPAFVLVIIVVVMMVMNVVVIPQMESLYASFNGAKLPLLTRIVVGFSHFLSSFWYLVVAGFVGLYFLFRWYKKTDIGRASIDRFKINVPSFGKFMRNVYIARFTRVLSGLVGSGVSLLDSLKIVSKAIGNTVYSDIITEAAVKVKGGVPLSTPLREAPEFPPIVSQMIRVGEQTGELDNMLTNLADYYEEEVDNFVKNITSILEPLIIVVMAIMVGVLLVGIMLPIYQFGKII